MSQIDYRSLLQDALIEMRQMRAELEALTQSKTEPIAIVGMDCRFPGGANSPEAYWDLLRQGVDAITEIPPDRWDVAAHYDPDPEVPGKMYSRYGGFIDRVDQFDPQFFGISPREAISLDPQQRLLLEVSYTALERAGQSPDQLQGSATGVFIGLSFDDYAKRSLNSGDLTRIDAYSSLGNTRSIAVGRIAYVLGLQGPTMQVDTTCSSSLLAVHLACQSLRSGECNLALAGGVSLMLSPEPMIGFCKLKALAPDGRSRTFDANAGGYGRGEGCGIVVLKRLSDAVTHKDNILAIVRGSAINHDGKSNGLTAPNGTAQEAVICQAIANAKVEPHQIQYVETHGTGTTLGDPIEVLALSKALTAGRSTNQPLRIGSVKTNIGHLEAAAGVASLIKVVLSLQHQQIPPHLHFQQPNPYIPWRDLSVTVPTQLTPWESVSGERFAGVSSFGMSGTNAHLVLQGIEPRKKIEEAPPRPCLLTLSAKSEVALHKLAQDYQQFIDQYPEYSLEDICFTANTGRSHFEYRVGLIASNLTQLRDQLCSFLSNRADPNIYIDRAIQNPSEVAFSDGMQTLTQIDCTASLEMDPKSADLEPTLLSSLAQLYTQGAAIDWAEFDRGQEPQRIVLPTYPFQRQRHWLDIPTPGKVRSSSRGKIHPLLGQVLHLAKVETVHFEQPLCHAPAYLKQHRVLGQSIMPAAGYIEMAWAAAAEVLKGEFELSEIAIHQALSIADETIAQLILTPIHNGYRFEIFSGTEIDNFYTPKWKLHITGNAQNSHSVYPPVIDRLLKQAQCQEISVTEFYQSCYDRGIEYGQDFQSISQLWQGTGQALGKMALPQSLNQHSTSQYSTTGDYYLHPSLLDAALQVAGAALPVNQTYLPVGVERFIYHAIPTEPLWSYAEVRSSQGCLYADIQIFDDKQPIATIEGLQLQPVGRSVAQGTKNQGIEHQDWLYQVEWRSQPLPARGNCFLTPAEIMDQIAANRSQMSQPDQAAYGQLLSQLEQLSLSYVVRAFHDLGWPFQPQQCFSTIAAAAQMKIASQHQRLLHRLLEILAEASILKQQADHWQVLRELPDDMAQVADLQTGNLATAEFTLLHRCGSHLAAVLRGETDPLQLIFPDGDLTIATHLYQDSPGATLMNSLAQQMVKAAISRKPPNQPLRILEIGAGTGSTTSYLLPILDAATTEYLFTDISTLFTSKASCKFQDYSFVKYQILDIEQSLQSQGYALHAYDIVIAANVVHATSDIRHSLTQIQSLLVPGGMLVMLEGIRPMRWLDLIFGLTAGWWNFTDRPLRSHYPLLSVSQWQQVLQQCGFDVSAITPDLGGVVQQAIVLGQVQQQTQWLILSDRQGIGEQLAVQLRAKGQSVTLVFSGDDQQVAKSGYQIDAGDRSQFEQILAQVTHETPVSTVYLWGLDAPAELDIQSLETSSHQICGGVLNLVQALSRLPAARLWLVTRAAVSLHLGDRPVLSQSPLWGLGKVIALEHPEWNCRCIDLDQTDSPIDQANLLLTELLTQTLESQVVWRRQQRYVARLAHYLPHHQLPDQPQTAEMSQLAISERGTLGNLYFQPLMRRAPTAHEVEIQVQVTGLNFRDLLNALGLYPGDAGLLGCECVGEVVNVGAEVDSFNIGDTVVAIASGSFSQYVTVDANMVALKPDFLTLEAAATLPVAFLTAFYSLHRLAKLGRGDRVLIHAATGGVGQAAIQLAQQAGAEIFATASPGKWEALRAMGVTQIFNSRSPDFATQINQQTNGEGVDVVLNSLAGEFISASLSVLKPNGRFIELGKADLGKANLGKAELSGADHPTLPDGISYWQIDLVKLCQQQPELIQSMLRELIPQFQLGQLQPLPFTVFPIQQVEQAFRTMQQAKHLGKIVVRQVVRQSVNHPVVKVEEQATYLITGGLGGLGLLAAEWLVEQGARHLVLISRSQHPETDPQIQALKQAGAEVVIALEDVAQQTALAKLLDDIAVSMPPLRGVIHAAGVLKDGLLQRMTWEQMATVLSPKMLGAWNLHSLTQAQSLDFFVLFSSATALLGSPGQANHVAANTFLDTLTHYRQAIGQPALSINWGVWSDVGSAADRATQIDVRGIGAIAPQPGIQIFAQLLQQSVPQVGVMPIRWREFLQQGAASPFFTDFAHQTEAIQSPQSSELLQLQWTQPHERRSLLEQHLRDQLAQVLGFNAAEIDPQKGFFDLGMDSLTSVELKNRLQNSLGCSLPATAIFDYPTLETLLNYLLDRIFNSAAELEGDLKSDLAVELSEPLPLNLLDQLTQDEIADLLAQELNEIERGREP